MDDAGPQHDHLSAEVNRNAVVDKKHDNTLKELSTALALQNPEQDIIRKKRITDLSAYTNSSDK